MVDLFKKLRKEWSFAEADNTPLPGGELFDIAYLLILRTGGM